MKTSVILIFLIVIFILFSVSDCTYNNDEVCTPRYKDTVVTKRNPCEVVPDGLIACYAFNGNADDGSIYGRNGIIHGSIFTKDRHGDDNSALYFDGIDDYVIAPDNLPLRVECDITLAVWFKTVDPNLNTSRGTATILSKYFGLDSVSYSLFVTDTSNVASVNFGLFSTGKVQRSVNLMGSYWDDKWHFIAASYNCSTGYVQLYIDGIMNLVYFDKSYYFLETNKPLTIGCSLSPFDITKQEGFFHGSIDDILIYNRVLKEEEIKKIYEN